MASKGVEKPGLPRFLLLWIFVPFIVGYFVARIHLDTVESFVKPYLDHFLPKTASFINDHRILHSAVGADADALNAIISDCVEKKLSKALFPRGNTMDVSIFENVTIGIHRNGESESCGQTSKPFYEALKSAVEAHVRDFQQCPSFDKYSTESLLTRALREMLGKSCPSPESDRSDSLGLYGFCDMGEARTPILQDHMRLVPISVKQSNNAAFLPCHFHTDQGVRVTSLPQLVDLVKQASCSGVGTNHRDSCDEISLFAVQAGRVFLFAASRVGQIIDLPHVKGGDPSKPVYLEVLSVRPAVFDLHNFFTKDESAELVERALKETKESHRIKRSTTGDLASTENVNQRRTSESGFDTNGKTSMTIKRRCFDVLGFDEYLEGHADGLQILRYNLTTAYIPHMDWFGATESATEDYDSAKKGGNRFATILLYMSDLADGAGGETVFTEAWPSHLPENERVSVETALEEFRASDQHNLVKTGSWQEKMVSAGALYGLFIKLTQIMLYRLPNAGQNSLYNQILREQCYSILCTCAPDRNSEYLISTNSLHIAQQRLPNGKPDKMSEHGACPVLEGQKWAANLWTWSTPRPGYPGSPKRNSKTNTKRTLSNTDQTVPEPEEEPGKVVATFKNSGGNPATVGAALYYFDGTTESFWGDLGPDDAPFAVNTYPTHMWRVKVGDTVLKQWDIDESTPKHHEFVI